MSDDPPALAATPSAAGRTPAAGADAAAASNHGLHGELAGRRVLITGARGFIGAHLTRRLVAAGADVHAITRRQMPAAPGFRWWRCDLTDAHATHRIVAQVQPEVILHLASRVQGHRDPDLVLPMIDDNLRAAVILMRAALALRSCRVVLAGSIEEPRTPDCPPSSPYAAAKAAATAEARLFHDQWDLPVSVLRVAMVYGPGQPDMTKLVPYVITSLLRGEVPRLSSGRRLVDWVYVDDVVEAFLAAATRATAAGHVVDVGSGAPVSIAETVATIAGLVDTEVALGFGRADDRKHERAWIADPEPAALVLGWRAHTSLTAGLTRTVTAYARGDHKRACRRVS